MKKASAYRQHAEHCRQLPRAMDGDQREQLMAMAAQWDRLALQRTELISRHPELDESVARERA